MTRPHRPPVIADVARAAGVSVPTVSRVLTGSVPVSAATRRRVDQAIEDLGYRPSSAARTLRSGRPSMIAVLAGNTARYGWARTIQGVEFAAREKGYSTIVAVIDSVDDGDIDAAIDLVLTQNVAGVIILEFDAPGREAVRKMKNVPTVAAAGGSRPRPSVPYALLDEGSAGREVTEHLLALGHRTVHHVAQPTLGRPTPRTSAWAAALRAAGAPVPEVLHADWTPRSAYEAGLRLATDREVTAVFCSNDDIAMAVARAFNDRGIAIPEDVSLVGFDNQPLSEFWQPALTTVHQDFEDLGRRAFRLLEALTEGGQQPRNSIVTPRLLLRETTCAPGARLAAASPGAR